MTAQISDSVGYRDRHFVLSRVKGSGLFHPTRHGLQPLMMSTGCYRGFICSYAVSNGGLFLKHLCIRLSYPEELKVRHGRGLPLFGKPPRYEDKTHVHVVYEDLHEPVPFSGGMLVADGFIQELRAHRGFPLAWEYKELHELLFEEGRLVEARDCSEAMARVHELIREQPLWPSSSASRSEIEQWLSKTFRRVYD